jgi:hypothetical protein
MDQISSLLDNVEIISAKLSDLMINPE